MAVIRRAIALLLTCLPVVAHAQPGPPAAAPAEHRAPRSSPAAATGWASGGVLLRPYLAVPHVLSDGTGGGFFVMCSDSVYVQRLDANGDFVAGWPALGVQLFIARGLPADNTIFMARDHAGGFYGVGQFPSDLYVTRVTPGGAFAPGFTSAGTALGAIQPFGPAIAADAGGAYVAWGSTAGQWIQRFAATGGTAPGWPAGGILAFPPTSGGVTQPILISDGGSGAYLVINDGTDLFVERYDADGSMHAGWPGSGVHAVHNLGDFSLAAALLDGGDLMLTYSAPLSEAANNSVCAQRISSAGAIASGWPAADSTPVILSPDTYEGEWPKVVPDGADGAIFSWFRMASPAIGDLYAQRLDAGGAIAPGWPSEGVLLNDPLKGNYEFLMHADGAGGAIVSWVETPFDPERQRVQRVTPSGLAPGWPASGTVIIDNLSYGSVPSDVDADGAGGAVYTWFLSNVGVMAGKIAGDAVVPALAALVDAVAEPGLVRLHWFAPSGVSAAVVERLEVGAEWRVLATIVPDGGGHLRFEDTDVFAGRTYSYRLASGSGVSRSTFGEVTLTVPAGAQFALGGFRPNPPDQRFQLVFTLPDDAPAHLEVLDIAGRRVAARELDGLGAGQHVVSLGELARLTPGLYFVRLTRGGQSLSARLVRME